MKPFIISILCFGMLSQTKAQQTEGTITYERKQNMHKMLNNESMKAFMPEFQNSNHQLLFSKNSSLYKTVIEDELPEAGVPSNGPMIIRRGGGPGNDQVFKDYSNNTKVILKEFLGNKFLVSDSLKTVSGWKLTDETKVILGFTCRKAIMKGKARIARTVAFSSMSSDGEKKDSTMKNTEDNSPKEKEVDIVAWYTEAISLPVGPEDYGQLPGAILELNFDNDMIIFTAKDVKKKFNAKELKAPTEGKKVTQAEFEAESKELMKNMQMGGGVMFRSNN